VRDFDEFRRRAEAVRQIPLATVLAFWGAIRDPHDRAKWHTQRGPLSVAGSQFTAWHTNHGGGGAIDLMMHLAQVDVGSAVAWLEQHLGARTFVVGPGPTSAAANSTPVPEGRGPLRLPVPNDRQLNRVRHYLKQCRGLSGALLESLIQAAKLYADHRANAVFLLLAGKPNRPLGAELRGTGPRLWRGMASGTRKDLGFFWLGDPASRQLVLCESAVSLPQACMNFFSGAGMVGCRSGSLRRTADGDEKYRELACRAGNRPATVRAVATGA